MSDFFLQLDDSSAAYLMIRYWGPPIISIVVGGLFASVLFPRWQERHNRARALGDHKVRILEEIAEQFTLYIAAWRRLISISRLELTRDLSEREMGRKDQYVAQRGDSRDALICALAKAKIYFSRTSRQLIEEFLEWDRAIGSKALEDLPPVEEWREWEERIGRCLRYEVSH